MALRECIDCHGTGKVSVQCSACDGGRFIKCPGCGGYGLDPLADSDAPCPSCDGEGSWRCGRCEGSGKDPELLAPCPHCQGTGTITEERLLARQAELEQARIDLEAQQRQRAERWERQRSKDKNTLALFAIAAGGGLLGLVPAVLFVVTAVQNNQLTSSWLTFLLLALAGLAIGPALTLQLYYGDTKRCLVPAFTSGLGYGALGLIAAVIVTFVFTKFEATVITLLVIVMVVALIAVNRARAAPGY